MSEKFGRLALHMWTIDTTPLATALDAAKQAGYDAVELRRTDFKRCFDAGMSNTQVLDLIKASGIPCGVLGVEYGWLFATGEESKRLFKVFRESCENAVALGCNMLMSAPGQVQGPIKDAIQYLKRAGDIAAEYDLRLAIEFNSQHDVLNSLGVLHELIKGAGKGRSSTRSSTPASGGPRRRYGGGWVKRTGAFPSFRTMPASSNSMTIITSSSRWKPTTPPPPWIPMAAP